MLELRHVSSNFDKAVHPVSVGLSSQYNKFNSFQRFTTTSDLYLFLSLENILRPLGLSVIQSIDSLLSLTNMSNPMPKKDPLSHPMAGPTLLDGGCVGWDKRI